MQVKRNSAVRPFTNDDIPAVADLYQRVFLPTYAGDLAVLRADLERYFADVFFASPCQDEFVTSLVCTDAQGRLAGFVGVLPRRMSFKGRPLLVANSFHFMAAPGSGALAGVQLLKALFSGPQDLTFSDHGGDLGRRVWEGLGGTTALAQSFNWVRVLRPTAYAARLARAHGRGLAVAARLAAPFCQLTDQVLAGVLPHWLVRPNNGWQTSEPRAEILAEGLERFSASYALRPAYDAETLSWLLKRAAQLEQQGSLQTVALRDGQGELAGAYIYYLKTAGASQVLLLAARAKAYEQVLDHLFWHAWQRGALALAGRLDPRFMRELTTKRCRFDGEGGWTLVHSNDTELLQAIYCGDAWLSRLEGERCLLYQSPQS